MQIIYLFIIIMFGLSVNSGTAARLIDILDNLFIHQYNTNLSKLSVVIWIVIESY